MFGFKICKVVGATYPALAIDPDAKHPITGLLAKNLTKTMVDKLDLFEGQNYGRAPIKVTVINDSKVQRAQAYLPKTLMNLYGEWNFEYWYENHMSDFITSLQDNCQIT